MAKVRKAWIRCARHELGVQGKHRLGQHAYKRHAGVRCLATSFAQSVATCCAYISPLTFVCGAHARRHLGACTGIGYTVNLLDRA